MIAFILIWLLTLDACETHTPQPIVYEEEVAPVHRTVEQPKEEALKNMSEKKRLELLEGQVNWMQKRIGDSR